MDVITIAKKMAYCIEEIKKQRDTLTALSTDKATAKSKAERLEAVTLIKLKNGSEMEIDNQKIKNPPVTIMEKIVKGICWEERLHADKAEALYKATTVNIQSMSAELNGLQSINKYIAEEVK